MGLRWAARGARMAEMARERIAKTGMAPGGRPVWTARELALLAVMFPDYKRAVAVLERRTYAAVKNQARSMGLTDPSHIWTGAAVARLRKLHRAGDRAALLAAFPEVPKQKIKYKIRHLGLISGRSPFKITGIPPIDLIRQRAFDLNISMVELDAMASTKKYFQKAGWLMGNINHKAIARAAHALDGLISVQWKDRD